MKKSIILLFMISIFLVKCFSPYEITKEKFLLDSDYKLLGVVDNDGDEIMYDETAVFGLEADSLLYVSYLATKPLSKFSYYFTDTLSLDYINSVYVEKIDGVKILLYFSGAFGLFYLLVGLGMSGGS